MTGERIAHYRLVRKLGAGGMGEVHRAVDERLGREVAIKLLPAHVTRSDVQTRLLREAQAAGQLNHPGIVTVHDVGVWRQRVYLVMELVEGRSLASAAREGMTVREAVRICTEAATAMAAAHKRGILHRDIKPDNIMLTSDGRVKILDFGLAKLRAEAPVSMLAIDDAPADVAIGPTLAGPDSTPGLDPTMLSPSPLGPDSSVESPWASLTFAGSLLGTPAYMSPEQAAAAPLDARSDVYSLGLVLYELVSGKRPLVRDSVNETLDAARAADVPPLDSAPRPLARLLSRALAAAPADRFADMDAFAAELAAVSAALTPRWRKRALLGAGAAVLAGGAATVAIAAVGGERAPEPRADFVVRATRSLTIDPGCEELPAFTPDGREILYDGEVDRDTEILAITPDGKTRRRLTHSPGWDIGAAPSPDGRRVAYIHYGDRGRELRVMGIEGDKAGEPIAIGPSRGFPAWTRDGELIYGDDSGRLLRVALDRTPVRPEPIIELPPDHIAVQIGAFADGEIIASAKSRAETSSLVQIGRARPGGRLQLDQPPLTISDCCDVRPDRAGRGFYFVALSPSNYSVLHWRARDGGAPIALDQVATVQRGFDVAPAGDRVALSSCFQEGLIGVIEDGELVPLPRMDPNWNPASIDVIDRDRIVISSPRSGRPQIWRLVRGQPELLVEESSRSPALSPDGNRLAWTGIDTPGIHLRALAGGPVARLTDDASDDSPAFAHDGSRLYFVRTGADGARVHAVAADGSGPAQPVSPTGVITFAVDPGRDRIALIIARGEVRELQLGPPGGPFETIPVPGAETMGLVAFAGDELLVAPRVSLLLALAPGGRGEPRVVWSGSDDMLMQVRASRGGELYALVSSDEGDLYLIDGAFR
jgi:predicted Ser/Thr protein kinase